MAENIRFNSKITYYFPNLAFQLFAVKKLKKIKDEFS